MEGRKEGDRKSKQERKVWKDRDIDFGAGGLNFVRKLSE